jgi:hypothetical protein
MPAVKHRAVVERHPVGRAQGNATVNSQTGVQNPQQVPPGQQNPNQLPPACKIATTPGPPMQARHRAKCGTNQFTGGYTQSSSTNQFAGGTNGLGNKMTPTGLMPPTGFIDEQVRFETF